jgi:hypothetical protein
VLELVPHTKRRKMRVKPSLESVRELFAYDASTGAITRRVSTSSNARAGAQAGSLDARGYLIVSIGKVQWKAHRVAWLLHYGEWPVGWIDHINRDRTDNRIENLRVAEPTISAINRSTWGRSKYRGVYYDAKWRVWRASIRFRGDRTHLGPFQTEEDAARGYDTAAKKVHGSLAVLNFAGSGDASA